MYGDKNEIMIRQVIDSNDPICVKKVINIAKTQN